MIKNLFILFTIFIQNSFSKNVILIGCDGFGQIYLQNSTSFLPAFSRLYKEGTTFKTGNARNQFPTVSAPNWATILTGQDPMMSGIVSNEWLPNQRPNYTNGFVNSGVGEIIPDTIWRMIKNQNKSMTTGAFLSWDWPKYLIKEGDVDYYFGVTENDTVVMDVFGEFLRNGSLPTYSFIHLDQIDHAGHKYGWGSSGYYNATKNVDKFIGSVLNIVESLNDILVIVTADHGGWRTHHDYRIEASLFVPIFFWGNQIPKNKIINDSYYNHVDLVPTTLNLMDLDPYESPNIRGYVHKFY